jgi:hypothetical protein
MPVDGKKKRVDGKKKRSGATSSTQKNHALPSRYYHKKKRSGATSSTQKNDAIPSRYYQADRAAEPLTGTAPKIASRVSGPVHGSIYTMARVGEQRWQLPRRPIFSLSLERHFRSSPKAVWEAFTEAKVRNRWFGAEIVGQVEEVGAPLKYVFPGGEDIAYGKGNLAAMTESAQSSGEVYTSVSNPAERVLEFRWGFFVLRAEIRKEGKGSTLVFSTTFEDVQWAAWNAAVWDFRLDNLDTVLQGRRVAADFDMGAVLTQFDHYAGRFETDFGTQMKL